MATIFSDLQLYQATYNQEAISDATHLTEALMTDSEWLSPVVTYAFGSSSGFSKRNFPLTFVTEGMNNIKSIGSVDLAYKVPILGKPKKTSAIAVTAASAGDKAGVGYGIFEVEMEDREFFMNQVVYTPSRLELQVKDHPQRTENGWKYKFQIMTNEPTKYVPVKDLQRNVLWAGGIAKVGKKLSKGVESRSYTPYAAMNQITVSRHSYNIGGNTANKVMILEITVDGKSYKFWAQWEIFIATMRYKEACEIDLWNSTYNRTADGRINQRDFHTDEVIPSGAGLLQQIPNVDYYTHLTTKKLSGLIRDIFFNASDADKVFVDIYTGTGGMEEAHKAMAKEAASFQLVDTNFVKPTSGENPNSLQWGGYFSTYIHQDGHTVRFIKLPAMDRGAFADISHKHPITGLPLEGYHYFCVDNSIYDGMRNLQYINEKGRENIEFYVAGAAAIPGSSMPIFRASDIDASSIQWIKTHGIHAMHPTNCFKMFNTIS